MPRKVERPSRTAWQLSLEVQRLSRKVRRQARRVEREPPRVGDGGRSPRGSGKGSSETRWTVSGTRQSPVRRAGARAGRENGRAKRAGAQASDGGASAEDAVH